MTLPKDPTKKSEYLRKMSERMKGKIPWNKGIKQWPEGLPDYVLKKISEKIKGKKQSEEHIKKRIESRMKNIDMAELKNTTKSLGLKNKGAKYVRNDDYRILQSVVQTKYWQSEDGNKRKLEMSQSRKNKPRSPEMKMILRNNNKNQIFPLKNTKPERMMQIALALNGLKFKTHKLICNNKDFWHQVDIFIEPNICIEVDGDYWHRLPKNIIRDNEVNHYLGKNGYFLIRLWESDIKKNTQGCAEIIIKMIQERKEIIKS